MIVFCAGLANLSNHFLFAEYASRGCLYDFLSKNTLDFQQILKWSKEIALGNVENKQTNKQTNKQQELEVPLDVMSVFYSGVCSPVSFGHWKPLCTCVLVLV